MRVVLSWLRELCPTDLPAEELAEVLHRQGVHIEGVLRPWSGLQGVVVARVLEVRDHPNSEKLCLARVDTGGGERGVVVGVRNMEAGDLVPYAPPGSRLPGLAEPLGTRRLRGETSEGMLCSPRELAVSADHGGILILPSGAPLGADVTSYLGLDDAVLDVEIEPNRPDLMSVLGVAREAAAATGVALREPDRAVAEGQEKAADLATVEILDRERCPRYLARVIRGVVVGPSPVTVQARLFAAGMRPVSNVVDATNYAMLELGQPMHPFDLDLLAGPAIVVRRAAEGERLVTLDDVERTLTADDLVIADRDRAVAVAGVMGSAPAEVSEDTVDVLLESAHFARTGVLRTARRLGLATEASMRFERGADPEGVAPAADRAAALIAAWSGGTVAAGAVDVGSAPPRRRVTVRPHRASLLAGFAVSETDVREAFGRLGIAAAPAGPATADPPVEVEVPGYRVDLEREVDLIEEVVRLRGYDRIPSALPGVRQSGGEQPSYAHRRRVREALLRSGLRETISPSFASGEDLELMGTPEAVRVANPLTAEQEHLRTSLVPALLRALAHNAARHRRDAALFEVGRVFAPGEPPREDDHMAFALMGEDTLPVAGDGGVSFLHLPRDVVAARGVLEALMASLGIAGWSLGEAPGPPYHPSRSAAVLVDGRVAGVLGELHPAVAARLDLPGRVALCELDSGLLAERATRGVAYREVPRVPPVRRDLAFLVDGAVPAGRVEEVMREAAGALLETAVVFDVFAGPPLPEGKKNLAFAVTFRDPQRTLTDEEIDAVVAAVATRLASDLGAELRAG